MAESTIDLQNWLRTTVVFWEKKKLVTIRIIPSNHKLVQLWLQVHVQLHGMTNFVNRSYAETSSGEMSSLCSCLLQELVFKTL